MGECDAKRNPIFYEMLSYIYTKCGNSFQSMEFTRRFLHTKFNLGSFLFISYMWVFVYDVYEDGEKTGDVQVYSNI